MPSSPTTPSKPQDDRGRCSAAFAVGRAKLVSREINEPSQRGDHRPRRSRQDHARRPALPPVGHLPRQPARGRARDGFQRPRERARDHHSRQVHLGRVGRHAARPRTSTSSTRPATPISAPRSSASCRMVDGVILLVDAAEGPMPQTKFVTGKALAPGPQADRRRQQDRPPRRAPGRSARRSVRAVPEPRGQRRAARLPDALRLGPRRLCRHAPTTSATAT